MTDYFVNVQLQNCAPLSCRASVSQVANTHISNSGTASVWVDRRDDQFTIFVSWSSDDWSYFAEGGPQNDMFSRMPAQNRGDGTKYCGFTVMNGDIMTAPNPNGSLAGNGNESVTLGAAIYPTVSFQIMGVDNSVENASRTSLNQANPVLTLL
jgi:hypothetical protein